MCENFGLQRQLRLILLLDLFHIILETLFSLLLEEYKAISHKFNAELIDCKNDLYISISVFRKNYYFTEVL